MFCILHSVSFNVRNHHPQLVLPHCPDAVGCKDVVIVPPSPWGCLGRSRAGSDSPAAQSYPLFIAHMILNSLPDPSGGARLWKGKNAVLHHAFRLIVWNYLGVSCQSAIEDRASTFHIHLGECHFLVMRYMVNSTSCDRHLTTTYLFIFKFYLSPLTFISPYPFPPPLTPLPPTITTLSVPMKHLIILNEKNTMPQTKYFKNYRFL